MIFPAVVSLRFHGTRPERFSPSATGRFLFPDCGSQSIFLPFFVQESIGNDISSKSQYPANA
jgi:hypothetical protein